MSKITKAASDRCAKKSLQEQLEDARHQMQRDNGARDMQEVHQVLEADRFWGGHHARLVQPIDGAD